MVTHMTASAAVPHFHFCDEVCMAALARVRGRLQGDPALGGARLPYLPFILKVGALHALGCSADAGGGRAPPYLLFLAHSAASLEHSLWPSVQPIWHIFTDIRRPSSMRWCVKAVLVTCCLSSSLSLALVLESSGRISHEKQVAAAALRRQYRWRSGTGRM